MAALPDIVRDPTLEAVDAALEAQQARRPRDYLGMSAIGRACERELWYSFRWASSLAFNAATLKRFADGHHGEDLQAARLRLVNGIELHTEDADGGQYGFYDLGGHLRGHIDGAILGLIQAPKTWHIWEHKQVDEKKQRALDKAIREHGEKAALAAWDPVYHAQAQLYMHFAELTRHYLTCSTPGGRHTISVRTDYHMTTALELLKRAEYIITADEPPPRISEDPDHFQCRWCDHREICHGGQVAEVSCRTCVHATAELDGDRRWSCARWGKDLSVPEQVEGCDQHLFIPAMVPLMVADANEAENSITYGNGMKNGGIGGMDSKTLREVMNECDRG
jgi:hypothetical protein